MGEPIAHLGFVVADLRTAAAALEEEWGLTFVPTLDADLAVHVGREIEVHHITSMWSQQGPPHIELIQEAPGSPWQAHPGIDHVGYWLESAALRQELAELDDSVIEVRSRPDAPVQFAYLRDPTLGRIEIVDVQRRAAINAALGRSRVD